MSKRKSSATGATTTSGRPSTAGNATGGEEANDSKPGELSIPEPYSEDELMYVLDGKIVLIDDQGNREEYVAGEGVVLPRGWTGTFSGPEGARKIWVSYEGGKK